MNHFSLPSSRIKFSLAPEPQPDVLHDPDGGAPGLVGGQPHVVALHVQAPHEEAEYFSVAAAVTPVYRLGQQRHSNKLSNRWPPRDYLKVLMKAVIPWSSLTLAITSHWSSTWMWVRSCDSVRVLEQGGQYIFLEKPGRGDFLPRDPASSVQAVII